MNWLSLWHLLAGYLSAYSCLCWFIASFSQSLCLPQLFISSFHSSLPFETLHIQQGIIFNCSEHRTIFRLNCNIVIQNISTFWIKLWNSVGWEWNTATKQMIHNIITISVRISVWKFLNLVANVTSPNIYRIF